MSAVRECRSINYAALGYALAGRIPASILGAMAFTLFSARWMSVLFASLILLAVAMNFRGWRVKPGPRNYMLAGVASGVMGTITSVGAPPMAIVFQNFSGPQLRATIGSFFVVGALMSLTALARYGRFGMTELNYGIGLILPMAAGFALSNKIVPYIRHEHMRIVILLLSGGAALLLLVLQFV